MGIFFPGNWPAEAEAAYLLTLFGVITICIIVLLCVFLFPTPIKQARETIYARLVDCERNGQEAVKTALKMLRSSGHEQATVEWSLALSRRDINRLDEDSKTQVMVVKYFAEEPQKMRSHLDFLEEASWWNYRKFAWSQLRWKDAQPMSITLVSMIPFIAYIAGVLVAW